MRRKVGLYFLLGVVVLALPSCLEVMMIRNIEKQLAFKVEGNYRPNPFFPSFTVTNVHFNWEERVELLSGSLKVRYPVTAWLGIGRKRLKMASDDLEIRLLGGWAESQGVSRVVLDRFYADLEIGRRGIEDIHQVEAEGPQFQFFIRTTPNH